MTDTELKLTDVYQKDSATFIRRRQTKLPSVRRHLLNSVIVLGMFAGGIGLGLKIVGNPGDAVATGEIGIDPAPLPAAADSLDGNGTVLPDLLGSDVPQGTNPTEGLDALGNPINPNELAGSETVTEPVREIIAPMQPQPQSSGPRTILIDGEPIGGAGFPSAALPRAPFADITRSSPYGRVPITSPTGKRAVSEYARPFSPAAGKQQVAIIIGGLGIDRNLTRRIINETPPEVTLSFAAHANGLQTFIHQARDRGHEVMIELPMEGNNFNPAEPGADRALKADVGAAMNIRNLDWLMSRAQGFFAVTNYSGDKIVARGDAMSPVLAHLGDSGLGFIYDGSSQAHSMPSLAASSNLPFKQAYTIIDENNDMGLIMSELDSLSAASQSGSPQIGIGFALPETLISVKNWAKVLDSKGMELAPASYVLNR